MNIKDFYTITKWEFSHFSKKNILKNYKLYDKEKFLLTAKYICPFVEKENISFNDTYKMVFN